jgi:hypothetical protein
MGLCGTKREARHVGSDELMGDFVLVGRTGRDHDPTFANVASYGNQVLEGRRRCVLLRA